MTVFDIIPQDIKSRITLATLITIVLATLIFGITVYWKANQQAERSLVNRAHIEADIISQNIATSIIFDDPVTAEEILSTFQSDKSIISARLENKKHKHFAYYLHPDYESINENRIIVKREIYFKNDIVGTLILDISKEELTHQQLNITIFLGVTLCIIILVSYLLYLPIIKSLLLPLLNLHSISQQIANTRDYRLRASVKTKDEIGRLAKMFNFMLEQIENRDAMLENQVEQRTYELEKLAEEFRFRAFHDNLTGLPNRALLNERFEHSIAHAKRTETKFVCLLLDLDDFKTINDTKGHEFGDQLLVEVASRLKTTVRNEDFVSRLGGDEFVIILNDINDPEDVNLIAEKIINQINIEFIINQDSVKSAVSVGGALFPEHGEDISTLKRHADVAMYRAKDSGKNQFCLFSLGMQEHVQYRLMIQTGLEAALQEKQFEIYFQPKINSLKNTVVGCEALIRWNHPTEGFLTPNKFIPYAEEIGKVAEIDYFVINSSCEKIAEWETQLDHPVPIAINLSGRHFHDFSVVKVLEEALKTYEIHPKLIDIEITEGVLINDPDKAKKVVHAIKKLGFGISLDDFGTGYSSLEYLRTLPIDTVKLDRSFVKNIDINPQDRRLTKGIVSLARGLNLDMVAEGVETIEQLETLINLGCNVMQGYYFLPPSPNEKFLFWVKTYEQNHRSQ